jgi:hypothetical protein
MQECVPIIRDVTIWPRLVPSCKANMLNLKYRSTTTSTFNSQLEVAAFLFDQEFNTIAGEYPVPVKHFRLIFISAWTLLVSRRTNGGVFYYLLSSTVMIHNLKQFRLVHCVPEALCMYYHLVLHPDLTLLCSLSFKATDVA